MLPLITNKIPCMGKQGIGDKVEEVKWKGLGVNDHWQRMKDIMMETAHDICGMTKGSRRHKWKRGGGTRRLRKQLGIRR